MIQFNLLPDVKKQYVKAKRTKRLIFSASTIVSAAVVGVTVVLFMFVHVAQKKNISDLTKDIKTSETNIQATPDLNNILTVQNQLSLLPGLHTTKPETSKVFGYISFMTPKEVQLSSLEVDIEESRIEMTGSADSIAIVNKLVDNIKAVRYAPAGSVDVVDEKYPYTGVETDLSGNNEGASFSVSFTVDTKIFSNTEDVILRLGDQSSAPPEGGTQ